MRADLEADLRKLRLADAPSGLGARTLKLAGEARRVDRWFKRAWTGAAAAAVLALAVGMSERGPRMPEAVVAVSLETLGDKDVDALIARNACFQTRSTGSADLMAYQDALLKEGACP